MSRPLRFEQKTEHEWTVRTAVGKHAGDLVGDFAKPQTWYFYAVGTRRPLRFLARDFSTASAFLENVSRAFSA